MLLDNGVKSTFCALSDNLDLVYFIFESLFSMWGGLANRLTMNATSVVLFQHCRCIFSLPKFLCIFVIIF